MWYGHGKLHSCMTSCVHLRNLIYCIFITWRHAPGSPAFLCATLNSWVWPGDEARWFIIMQILSSFHGEKFIHTHVHGTKSLHGRSIKHINVGEEQPKQVFKELTSFPRPHIEHVMHWGQVKDVDDLWTPAQKWWKGWQQTRHRMSSIKPPLPHFRQRGRG